MKCFDELNTTCHCSLSIVCWKVWGQSENYPASCDGSIVLLVENDCGARLIVWRKALTATAAIRRMLRAREKGCGLPDCSHTRFVDAHHIKQ